MYVKFKQKEKKNVLEKVNLQNETAKKETEIKCKVCKILVIFMNCVCVFIGGLPKMKKITFLWRDSGC